MEENNIKGVKLAILNKRINEIRETLNEICSTLDESDTSKERLLVSQYLDELIVEYMNEMMNKE